MRSVQYLHGRSFLCPSILGMIMDDQIINELDNTDNDKEAKISFNAKKKPRLKKPLIILLASFFVLFLVALLGTIHFYQTATKTGKELALLRKSSHKEILEKEALAKQLKDSKEQSEVIARTRIQKEMKIDPLEAALLQLDAIPSSDESDSRIITHGDRSQKKVALTIDDGWNSDDRIIKLMEANDIKCTAFVIGGRNVAVTHKSWVKKLDKAGFEICTHTYSHYLVTGLTNSELKKDITKGQQVLTDITGDTYPFLRTCGGVYNERTLNVIADCGYKLVLWDVEVGDTYKNATVEKEVNNVLKNVKNGSIILCHFGGHNTYEVLKIIIPELKKRGYKITTVSDLLKKD